MTAPDITRALEVAREAARGGGGILRERLGKPGYLKWTGRRDVETEASLAAQDAIVATITEAFPHAGILAKLGPADDAVPVDAPDLWIVDPASGSLNYAHGVGHYAVTIALRSRGDIALGVVYDPSRDELFEAVRRQPSRLNGKRISVRRILEGQEAWNAAFIGTDWPQAPELRAEAKAVLGMMESQVLECNLMGSPALGLCYVAAGRTHLYWNLEMTIWDIAAAGLILEQAGGILTDRDGLSWLFSEGGYIASNNVIHGWALHCVRAVTRLGAPDPRSPTPLPEP